MKRFQMILCLLAVLVLVSGCAPAEPRPRDRSLEAIVLYYGTHVPEIPEHTRFSLCRTYDCWATHSMERKDVMEDRWGEFQHLYCAEGYEGTFPHVYEGGYACEDIKSGCPSLRCAAAAYLLRCTGSRSGQSWHWHPGR